MKHRNQGFDQIMQISFKQYLKKKKRQVQASITTIENSTARSPSKFSLSAATIALLSVAPVTVKEQPREASPPPPPLRPCVCSRY